MKPLRVDAHNGAPVWGGAEIALARIVAGLARRGHDVLLHCNDPEVERNAAALGAPTRRGRLGGDIALHHAARFARTLRRRRPDALLLGTFRKVWLGALAGRLAGVPRVVARIGLETDMPRNAKYAFVLGRWVDAVAFNADVMRVRFARALPAFRGALVTIHTGVPVPSGPPGAAAALRREIGVAPDAPVIGSVGRLASQKRYDLLVAALPSLPGVHALILGEGPEREALRSLARELGVAERLHLPGHREDVGPGLGAMDVFVLCSDREGMSNAMLEALAAGVPVVSTDVSGAREALAPVEDAGTPGVVLAAPEDLVPAVRALLADPARLAAMGDAARRAARARFGEERMLDDWERLLGGDG
ncbi:MAG TPA: glycosyltransferase [Longimicrobiales bacterium]|nr:glycosyltransferase [Longimicrobiales bacterium]